MRRTSVADRQTGTDHILWQFVAPTSLVASKNVVCHHRAPLPASIPGRFPPRRCWGASPRCSTRTSGQLIDLAEEGERLALYVATLHLRAEARGLGAGHQRFAIRNFGVLSGAMMRTTLVAIYVAMAAGAPVYLHCWGGVGRTGTVAGCLLTEPRAGRTAILTKHNQRNMKILYLPNVA